MPPVEGDMDLLTRAVLEEGRTEANQILSEARAKADAIRQRAEAQAAAGQQAILARASETAERIRQQAVAAAEVKARMLRLEHREKLLQSVFEAARRQIASVQQWKEYDQVAIQLLREGLTHLGANTALVRADAATGRLLTDSVLETVSKELNVKLTMTERLTQGLGIIVQTEDGRRFYDNTLETRLARLQNTLRAAVYHILMGEAL
jgi:V/A-type H+/Na+-transporting ATPase subunit E